MAEDYPYTKVRAAMYTKVIPDEDNEYPYIKSLSGLPNHMSNLDIYINPVQSCYTILNANGGNIQKYKATFKIDSSVPNEYIVYTDQIIIWNSPYITEDIAKQSIINTGIERDDFVMIKIS
jgi:hypothetical protein